MLPDNIKEFQISSSKSGIWRLEKYWFLFWFIWPFGAMFKAFSDHRNQSAKMIVWLFFVYFGFVFVIPADITGAADSARYAAQLIKIHNNPLSWSELLLLFYNPQEGYTDIYQPLVTWFVSLLTVDPRWMFAVFAGIFGFFYINNLWLILDSIKTKIKPAVLFFLLAFALVNPIWNINGMRMWTAAQVFLFGTLQYFLLGNKRKGILWCSISVFFHFSFMYPLALFISYLFIPKPITLFFVFYVASTFIRELNLTEVRNFLSFLPDVFQSRIQNYTNEVYWKSITTNSLGLRWHVTLAGQAGKWIIYSWVIIIYLKGKHWFEGLPEIKNLFSFALFLGGWAQIASLVPSGGRFMIVANSVFYLVIVLLMIHSPKNHQLILIGKITAIPLFFVVIFQIRTGLDFMGILTFFGNPLITVLFDEQAPLIEFIKSFF